MLFKIRNRLPVESVSWISERKDVFYLFFFLPAMLAYVRFARGAGVRYYWLTAAFFSTLTFRLGMEGCADLIIAREQGFPDSQPVVEQKCR